MIERVFDTAMVAGLASREKQVQQNYRPVIAVHKWFARRPGTLFRSLLLSEFTEEPLAETFYKPHDLTGHVVADPFMGGGTPLVEANRVGCEVVGADINPMAYWIVRQELEYIDTFKYRTAADDLVDRLRAQIGAYYQTRCTSCGRPDAEAKYFMWVKTATCARCGQRADLFPHYLLASNRRHPFFVVVCRDCGALNESESKSTLGKCVECGQALRLEGSVTRNAFTCAHCGASNLVPDTSRAPQHRMFAIEYYCPACSGRRPGRLFKRPDQKDLSLPCDARRVLSETDCVFVPRDAIPDGDESGRLLRWGYRYYRELFNPRQLLGLEISAREVVAESDERIRNALATNMSDLTRYQNMLCRYDTMALKSLDVFSIHGFPVSLVQCESNLLGIVDSRRRVCVGSGGWTNIIDKYWKAKRYCDSPFEIRHVGSSKKVVPVPGEWIGDKRNGNSQQGMRQVRLSCSDATDLSLPPGSIDMVLTDPPYLGNVQYAELMDFCYVWLRRILKNEVPEFAADTTRLAGELTSNETMNRGVEEFAEGLSTAFRRMESALKPDAPLVFTYHHNRMQAYLPIAVALLDAELTCTVSLPCPGEMSASIHISHSQSSVVDTVFVCRKRGSVSRRLFVYSARDIAALVANDVALLRTAGVTTRKGDARCILYGHMTRLAIWALRRTWDKTAPVATRLARVGEVLDNMGGADAILKQLEMDLEHSPTVVQASVSDRVADYAEDDEIPF